MSDYKFSQIDKILKQFGIDSLSLHAHDSILRICVSDHDFDRVIEIREKIVKMIKEIGFRFVTLDLTIQEDQ